MSGALQPLRNAYLETPVELNGFGFQQGGVPVVLGGAWGSITGSISAQADLQTALAGKLTQAAADALYAAIGHAHTFASLTSKPTTILGYGITDAYTKTEVDSAVSAAVVGLLDDRGNYNASGNVFPSTGGSGAAGAILKGDLWTISVGGTLNGIAVTAGDVVRALVDTPGQTGSNWVVTENNLGYVPVNTAGILALAGFSSITGTLPSGNVATLNQNTTGSAASLSISGQTALLTFVGLLSTNRAKTVRDAADTILELGGSYTPTGTWTNLILVTPALGTPVSGVVTNLTGSLKNTTAVAARAYNSANISISNATWTILTFDSERFDTDTIHDTVTNTGRLTAARAGTYLITGHVAFASNATGLRYLGISLNGAAGAGFIAPPEARPAVSGDQTCLTASTIYNLAAGDFVTLQVHQTSTISLNVLGGLGYSLEFSMVRMA